MIGIFGGSFDPPHTGHELIIREYMAQFPRTRKLYIVPNWQSPLKKTRITGTGHILEMTRLMIQSVNLPGVELLEYEINRQDIGYTVDTLDYIRTLTNDPVNLLIGEDNLQKFHLWKDYKKILANIDKLVVYKRKTGDYSLDPEIETRVARLESPVIDISSTAIRNDPDSESSRRHLNPLIQQYISQYELYRKD